MTDNNQVSRRLHSRGLATLLALFGTLFAGWAQAGPYEDIDLTGLPKSCHADPDFRTYGFKVGEVIGNLPVKASNGGAKYFLGISPDLNCGTVGGVVQCPTSASPLRLNVIGPDPNVATLNGTATISSNGQAMQAGDLEYRFKIAAGDETNPDTVNCTQTYKFHQVSDSAIGGWGDPHLTTFDGTHYDFQGAGEFTALRSESMELQTRQTPVPTATVPITNPYTGITHCVAIYTAAAARLGKSRVSLQPGPAGQAASTLQVRVNGKPVELTDAGIVLNSDNEGGKQQFDGQIRKADGGSIELRAADGAQIVVTPTHWDSLNLWYLSINVYQGAAQNGTMGRIHEGDWLPKLADGSGLGAQPESIDERYQQLYGTFADSWRVTDSSSLFDYETGTNTATFTLKEWPRNHPKSCDLEGQTSVQSTTQQAAEQACAAVTGTAEKADCVFDVAITGELGFAKNYESMQKFKANGPGWQTHADPPTTGGGGQPPPHHDKIPWWVWLLLILILILIIWFVRKKQGP